MKHSVVEILDNSMWDYDYHATKADDLDETFTCLASNSLKALKEAVKERGWKFVRLNVHPEIRPRGERYLEAEFFWRPRYNNPRRARLSRTQQKRLEAQE
jgi:hypothetical protein